MQLEYKHAHNRYNHAPYSLPGNSLLPVVMGNRFFELKQKKSDHNNLKWHLTDCMVEKLTAGVLSTGF